MIGEGLPTNANLGGLELFMEIEEIFDFFDFLYLLRFWGRMGIQGHRDALKEAAIRLRDAGDAGPAGELTRQVLDMDGRRYATRLAERLALC